LWHFKQVQQRLSTNALQPVIKIDLATHALKREQPGIIPPNVQRDHRPHSERVRNLRRGLVGAPR
jgi:hypothetical protein